MEYDSNLAFVVSSKRMGVCESVGVVDLIGMVCSMPLLMLQR